MWIARAGKPGLRDHAQQALCHGPLLHDNAASTKELSQIIVFNAYLCSALVAGGSRGGVLALAGSDHDLAFDITCSG